MVREGVVEQTGACVAVEHSMSRWLAELSCTALD